jgi:hypothetical protein
VPASPVVEVPPSAVDCAAGVAHQVRVRRGRALTADRRKTAFRAIGYPISWNVIVKA